MAIDRFGRRIHYLRISLTDHCNLRCLHCMPEEMTFRPNAELIQDNEILTLTQIFALLGFDKIRLTGGEPTMRLNIVDIVRGIAATPGVSIVTMTTNGLLLGNLAKPLASAGLKRINISLDTLNPNKFQRLTRYGDLKDVWKGLSAAEEAGLKPIKINVVIIKGYNEDDIVDLANLTLHHSWQVRFIEMMPFAGVTELQISQMVTTSQIQEHIERCLGPLEAVDNGILDGESRLFHIPGAQGDVGFISSISAPFCASCTRARLTSDGILRMCLLREHETDLLTPLRAGASREELQALIQNAIWNKPWGHGLTEGEIPLNRMMSEIGG